ncbi:uncharacterized protein UV8b_02707 [Ustilaginoidea virens]|uniref:Uncharacterized protein n=1 Tax=Ustilaginoidea virens TaxID=1159556 RepID=A0A8E5MG46_USTVR|nr:uncharacterized protein UV8b_02707 [Ustilaginoidea virens]QUC18466.1 hypothetical protein UV8b_02707 [Ustilaginoidea virens]
MDTLASAKTTGIRNQPWQQLAESLQISQDDFISFHQRHFSAQAVASFANDFTDLPSEETYGYYCGTHEDDYWAEEEDDDDLGYYDDGVKRTLTDEQVEMFRHSELRELAKNQERASTIKSRGTDRIASGEEAHPSTPDQTAHSSTGHTKKKKKKKGKGAKRVAKEPKPDLRKRTWDVVDAGLDFLEYD